MVYAGNQAGRVIVIAAGSVGGSLLLLVTIASTVIVLWKWKTYNLSANQTFESTNKPITLHTATVNADFGVIHGITEQQSPENWDSKLDMEHNVAYGSSSDAQISLTSNVAYYKSGKHVNMNMEHNVAYGSSSDAQISLTSNVAYYKSGNHVNMNMEHNVAYGSSTDAQISLTSNTAYYSKSGSQLEESCDYENDQIEYYDYI